MPEDRVFVDTNILIYSYDTTAGTKQRIAREIIAGLWNNGLGVISTQVLQEFYVNVVHKIPKPVNTRQAREIVEDFLKWHVVVNTGASVIEAIDICSKYHYSFWDSMIINAAIRGRASVLLSEDLQDGQVIKNVKIQNPF